MGGTNINDITIYGFYLIWGVILLLSVFKTKPRNFYIIGTILLLFSAIRYGSGTDYYAYQSIYESTIGQAFQSIGFITAIETFYLNFMILCHWINLNFFQFVAFHALLMMSLVMAWIKMSSRYPVFSIFVYVSFFFLVWNLSAFRQVIPLLIGSFLFYNPKINLHWGIRFTISLILVFFHYSALFLSVLLILEFIPWNKKRLMIFFSFGLLMSLVPIREIILSLNVIPLISNTSLYQKFFSYLSGMPANLGFFDIGSLMRIFFITLLLLHYDKLVGISPYLKKMVHVVIYGLSFFFFLKFSLITAQRLTIYALVLLTILIPEIVHLYDDQKKLVRSAALAALIGLNAFMYFKDLYAMKAQKALNEGSTNGKWYVEYHHIFEPGILDETK